MRGIHVKDGDRVRAGQVLIEPGRAVRLRAVLMGADRLGLSDEPATPPKLLAVHQAAPSHQQAASLARDRDRLLRLVAPVDGVVRQLAVNAPGAVVTQAIPVLMVAPDDDGIAIEAALPNKDAGFVRPGQAAEVKVAAFPFTRYGTIPAEVTVVSSDAMQGSDNDAPQRRQGGGNNGASQSSSGDGQGGVYSVRIHPERNTIHAEGRDVTLTPGMMVTAEIKTGKRWVIEYVLEPVMQMADESFSER